MLETLVRSVSFCYSVSLKSVIVRACIQEWSDNEFVLFCDSLEVDNNGTIAGPGGFGVTHALNAWADFWNNSYYSYGELFSRGHFCFRII